MECSVARPEEVEAQPPVEQRMARVMQTEAQMRSSRASLSQMENLGRGGSWRAGSLRPLSS